MLTLYTIGHSNLAPDDFLAALRQHNIMVLVDVRSAPYSRYVPHFSKDKLEAYLKANGVDYRFAGEFLGGQPKDETVYKHQVVPDEDTKREKFLKLVDYEAIMQRDWYRRGIQRLLEIVAEAVSTQTQVAIMCSEGNPLECHRHHLITRSLIDPPVKVTDQEVKVVHIVKDGNIEIVDMAAFAVHNQTPNQLRLF